MNRMATENIYIVHGWSSDKDNFGKWSEFINYLNNDYKVIFLKIPGLDFSTKDSWNLDKYVSWLDKEIQEDSFLIGHSFGGQLSIKYASKFPTKIKKVVLIDSSGIIDKSVIKVVKRNVFKFVTKVGKRITKSKETRKFLYYLARERDYYDADPILRETMKNILSEEILDSAKNIKCPTLIIWGKGDRVTPTKNAKQLNDLIQDSSLVFIDNARHSPQFTHSKEVSKICVNFFRKK